MEFKRPEGTPYPQVYSTFKVKAKDTNEVEEFYIQDLTEDFFDFAVDFIVENHGRGAVLSRAANTVGDEHGVQRVGNNYRNAFKENISLICLKKGTNEVVGMNGLTIQTKGSVGPIDTSDDDPRFTLFKEALNYLNSKFNAPGHYEVDQVLSAVGLAVDKKFRGRGIATEILKARIPLLKTLGLQVTSTIFSTVGAQKAALAAGFEENISIPYEEFKQKFPELELSFSFGTSCKVMSLKI